MLASLTLSARRMRSFLGVVIPLLLEPPASLGSDSAVGELTQV